MMESAHDRALGVAHWAMGKVPVQLLVSWIAEMHPCGEGLASQGALHQRSDLRLLLWDEIVREPLAYEGRRPLGFEELVGVRFVEGRHPQFPIESENWAGVRLQDVLVKH